MSCAIIGCKNDVQGKAKYCSQFCVTRSKLKTVVQWKKATWKLYSQYIKQRDADQYGYVRCVTCQKKDIWNSHQVHAGHFLHGDNPGTWVNDKNVHAQCAGCNVHKGGARDWYALELERRYGHGILQELDKAYNTPPLTWGMLTIRDMYQEVKKKLDDITLQRAD